MPGVGRGGLGGSGGLGPGPGDGEPGRGDSGGLDPGSGCACPGCGRPASDIFGSSSAKIALFSCSPFFVSWFIMLTEIPSTSS